jgi:hypothetical protein
MFATDFHSQSSRPLHALVKQVSQTQRKGDWASIRADKRKKMELADTDFREARGRALREERIRMEELGGKGVNRSTFYCVLQHVCWCGLYICSFELVLRSYVLFVVVCVEQ